MMKHSNSKKSCPNYCMLCMLQVTDPFIYPCGHFCCRTCYEDLNKNETKCSECKKSIDTEK